MSDDTISWEPIEDEPDLEAVIADAIIDALPASELWRLYGGAA